MDVDPYYPAKNPFSARVIFREQAFSIDEETYLKKLVVWWLKHGLYSEDDKRPKTSKFSHYEYQMEKAMNYRAVNKTSSFHYFLILID